ncbi:UNVERIFIED_CONTAM: putative mitochondrial protein [Sesamum radiatum]|uniref:Mitochondrial protein n=1 Tax=Sesamum radiatum TaxID=300843 RepID=A0AAW2J034_SESRA
MIPKTQVPVRVSDFRPIACCNVLYKAISKILVNRLQKVLHLLIDSSQTAFVPGRVIADNILLAQELLAGYNQAKLPQRCTIKVDIQKAYDSVNWDFLLESLRIFQFPSRFIDWIEQCVSTVAYSVLLNGSLHGFFSGSKGLRQGDPLSPYLFVIVMEIWHVMLRLRTQSDESFQYHWKCNDLGILNLCFADDVLIFCAGTGKPSLIIGFQEGSLPIKYLGVPLSSSRLTRTDCQPLLDKLARRLAGWNHLTLSLAGRTQVIKSVLNSLHIYWASAFLLPKAIIQILERKMREFLWKGSSGSGYAKVSWAQGQWRWPADTHFDIQEIMAELPSIGPQQTDVIRWKPGNFSSQSVFSFLQPASPPVLWHQLLGGKFKIPRHDFILWLAVLERLSTMDRLWASRSDAGCMLCGGQILETHEHLFFECSFSKRCLDLLKHRVRFQWLRCGWHRDVIWASGRWRGKHLLNQAFRAVLASIVYYIWRERNNRRFSATASSAEAVVSRAVEEVRCRIISANCKPSLQLFVLYRIWKIPWARP